jgi:hypothetical protein
MSVDYDSAVKKTFVCSLKSVFLVDDSFPTYEDMFGESSAVEAFAERDRARRLYSAFRERNLPCDIENSFQAGGIEMVERLRKCDLIVIDYHLDPGVIDNSKSIEILRKLADSPHFNTVIVYTTEDIDEAWMDIASNLRPDLRLDPFLGEERNKNEAAWWYDVDPSKLTEPDSDVVSQFLRGGFSGIERPKRAALCKEVVANGGKDKGDIGVMAEMLVRSIVDKRRTKTIKNYDEKDRLGARSLQGRFAPGGPHWLQTRGCFIAIVKKVDTEDEAAILMKSLNEALLDWRPNFLQLLVSEIQNALELDSVATNPKAFSDAKRQVGLSHYLLEQLVDEDDPESAVENVIDRIVETIRHGIAADVGMRKFATDVLGDVRGKLGAAIATPNKLANAAALAHVTGGVNEVEVVSFLNAFLSTERFAKSRITTGTVFSKDKEFWMVATPACDLTSRVPKKREAWMRSLHPVRAFIAIRLTEVKLSLAMATATEGKHAFILQGEEPLSLAMFDSMTSSPDAEMFFAIDAGKVAMSDGRTVFKAAQVGQSADSPNLSATSEYTVVGQLRSNYASRVLQVTGTHLSRIGIDFFNVGGREDA